MRTNNVRELLASGKPAIGAWLQLNSQPATRLLAGQGLLDWLLVDFEHSPPDAMLASALMGSISDISAGRVTPFARAADSSTTAIELALDCGAQGVIAPMIEDAEAATRLVKAARYAPQGERGAGGLTPHLGFGVSRPEYLMQVNKDIIVAVQVETAKAVRNIDEILAVPGIDLVFMGPNDLHMSLGLPPAFWSENKLFIDAVDRIKAAAKRHNLPMGTLSRDAATAKDRIAQGFQFVGIGSDVHYMLTFAGMEIGAVKGRTEPPAGKVWCDVVNVPVLEQVKG